MTDLEKLKDLNRKLAALLDDPQPGMFTWHDFLKDILKEISDFYISKTKGD